MGGGGREKGKGGKEKKRKKKGEKKKKKKEKKKKKGQPLYYTVLYSCTYAAWRSESHVLYCGIHSRYIEADCDRTRAAQDGWRET